MFFYRSMNTERKFYCFLIFIATLKNFETEVTSKRHKCKSDSFHCSSGECIHPLLTCDGINHCEDGSDETAPLCSNTYCPPFMFQCDYGGCVKISSICNGVYDCIDQSDEPPIHSCRISLYGEESTTKKPLKIPKPTIPNVIITTPTTTTTETAVSGWCKLPEKTEDHNYIINDCDKEPNGKFCSYKPGQYIDQFSALTLQCNPNYYSSISEITTAFCLEEKWVPSIVYCEECGLTTAAGDVNDNYVPWLVAVYDSLKSFNICWGILLSPYTVLTAAHCVFDERSKKKKEATNFYAIVGKHLTVDKNDAETKRYKIASISFINNAFDGAYSNYNANLAILEMDYKVTYTDYVKPVCVEWRNRINLMPKDGTRGMLPTWIINRQAAMGELRPQEYTYISNKNCQSIAPKSAKSSVTEDKFCVRLDTGTAIDNGNAGNGFFVKSPNRHNYHLIGVVSTHFYDNTNTPVLIITNFEKYRNQVQSAINEIEEKRKTDELIDVRFPTQS